MIMIRVEKSSGKAQEKAQVRIKYGIMIQAIFNFMDEFEDVDDAGDDMLDDPDQWDDYD